MTLKKVLFSLTILATLFLNRIYAKTLKIYKANDSKLHYVGRIDRTDALKPRFWNAGIYMQARFRGVFVEVMLDDQEQYGKNHNYIEIAVDDRPAYRVQSSAKKNEFKVTGLTPGIHTITVCKDTEAGIGYIEITGIRCAALLPWKRTAKHKIEYIGDSITCGTGSDLSSTPCGKGEWYDQHNAYMSYGPSSARMLNADWQLSSVSGIGLIHSCCDMTITMPQVFDKINMRENIKTWDFSRYTPEVVTICLGQNDGRQDSVAFCSAYVRFIQTIKSYYPKAAIVMLNSPMADEALTLVLKKHILGIEAQLHGDGVHHYFYSRRFHNGCGDHPDMAEQQQMAREVAGYIKQIKKW